MNESAPPTSASPEARVWAAQFLQAALEISCGLRQPAQLVRWVDEVVFAQLCRRAAVVQRQTAIPRQQRSLAAQVPCASRRAPGVLSVRASEVVAGVLEVSGVVHDGVRVKALACRIETRRERWRVTALEFG